MAKYGDWTVGEIEALLDIVGGIEVARAVFRGEKRIIVEDVVRQQPSAKPPLVGTVVMTLNLNPYSAKSIVQAIKRGKYDGVDGNIVQLFANDEVGLTTAVNVTLVQFDRDPSCDEVLAWAKENGDKKPILPKHIHAIGIQHREEQRRSPIVALGSVRDGFVLYLYSHSGRRFLIRHTIEGGWLRCCLFGFLSE